jgi:hypothetical protein
MKKNLVRVLPLLVLLFTATAFTFAPADKAEVRIDGKLVSADGDLTFERDDTVYLEATGIQPNSTIDFKIKKAGISWMKDVFEVDKTGEVKGIMHMPEQKLTVTCFIKYYSANGKFHDVKFKFRTR